MKTQFSNQKTRLRVLVVAASLLAGGGAWQLNRDFAAPAISHNFASQNVNVPDSNIATATKSSDSGKKQVTNLAASAKISAPKNAAGNSVSATSANAIPAKARRDSYAVVASYAHDRKAFTQGFFWHDGAFYEGTGLTGQSDVRRVEFPSGRVLDKRAASPTIFGEGLALAGENLVQLTWTDGRAFIYDRATLKPRGEFKYDGEGWGLTFDGRDFVMSNGSDIITFRDAKTFAAKRTIRVTLNGKPLTQLNELEWIDGEIWANVWQTDFIVRIDPKNGRVKSYLDFTGLLPVSDRVGSEDVLNGIAYDAARKRVFVTGKLWPKVFEITVN